MVGSVAGQAQVCKIVNNAISITGMVVACEAMVLGAKAGLDPAVMIDVINASTGRNSATVDKFPKAILARTFDYGGPMSIGEKDLNLYLEEARAQEVSSLAVSIPAQLWGDGGGPLRRERRHDALHPHAGGVGQFGEDGRPCRRSAPRPTSRRTTGASTTSPIRGRRRHGSC